MRRFLVTGATGKVGQEFLKTAFEDARFAEDVFRAFVHQRGLEERDRLEVVRGSIANRDDVEAAMQGVTHVLHLATSKETPDTIMDVAVKGLFWLLEACRESSTFRQFVLVGGDAAIGHFFYPHASPITEEKKHSAYPGCYALSKVLEEVMLEQYYLQYNLNGCNLRAPWIMEKDDFKYTLSFGEDVFGGPRWREVVGTELADEYQRQGVVPVLCDIEGNALRRNFVHVSDLVQAILTAIDHSAAVQETFNICMDEPVDYREVANHLKATRGLGSVDIRQPYHSIWLDNTKAKHLLNWRPKYDLKRLIDAAWDYPRNAEDPRIVWYPG